MPQPAQLTDFQQSLKNLDYTRKRMEALFQAGEITKRDLNSVYEALFLRAVTRFESFLEELFLAILERRVKYKKQRRVALKMKPKSRQALMEIVFQGDRYLDWLPFQRTADRASLYLFGGRPFTDLEQPEKDIIHKIITIRHAIAHHSKHATKQFQLKVIQSLPLLKGEKTPAGFLRSQVQPAINRFEVYISELVRIAADLCSFTPPLKKHP